MLHCIQTYSLLNLICSFPFIWRFCLIKIVNFIKNSLIFYFLNPVLFIRGLSCPRRLNYNSSTDWDPSHSDWTTSHPLTELHPYQSEIHLINWLRSIPFRLNYSHPLTELHPIQTELHLIHGLIIHWLSYIPFRLNYISSTDWATSHTDWTTVY
jgi:hypothetical protein